VTNVSVAEAARRLGVSVPRIHQRIADGSLSAERIGSQWVVDELSLLRAAERRTPGRPLSARSAWALVAMSEDDREALAELAVAERERARVRLERLLAHVAVPPQREADMQRTASELRSLLGKRASRELRKVADADLVGLRQDSRWQSLITTATSGIAMLDVDGYLAVGDLRSLTEDFLLMPASRDANVVIHVLPEGQKAHPQSKLLLAADLAERRGPREESRAVELLCQIAEARQEAGN
jgi:excisionase family DNA binding protein